MNSGTAALQNLAHGSHSIPREPIQPNAPRQEMTSTAPDIIAAHICDTGDRLVLELGNVFLLRCLEPRRFFVIRNSAMPLMLKFWGKLRYLLCR